MSWYRFLKNLLIPKLIQKKVKKGAIIVDVGSGGAPYRNHAKNTEYVSLDLSRNSSINVLGDVHNLPFQNECADIVLCTEVLEHCKNPLKVIEEIFRILKSNCTLILSFPFIYPVHLNQDYWRFTVDGIRLILGKRFEILEEYRSGTFSFYLGATIVARKSFLPSRE